MPAFDFKIATCSPLYPRLDDLAKEWRVQKTNAEMDLRVADTRRGMTEAHEFDVVKRFQQLEGDAVKDLRHHKFLAEGWPGFAEKQREKHNMWNNSVSAMFLVYPPREVEGP